MSKFERLAWGTGLAVVTYVGGNLIMSNTNPYEDSNQHVTACGDALWDSVVRVQAIPEDCEPYLNQFTEYTDEEDRHFFVLPPKDDFLNRNLATEEHIRNDEKADRRLVKILAGFSFLFAGLYMKPPTRKSKQGAELEPTTVQE